MIQKDNDELDVEPRHFYTNNLFEIPEIALEDYFKFNGSPARMEAEKQNKGKTIRDRLCSIMEKKSMLRKESKSSSHHCD